jgi:hypothetical protein
MIGCGGYHSPSNYMSSVIDDVLIYRGVLSGGEIKDISKATS